MKQLSALLTGAAMLAPLALSAFTANPAKADLIFQGKVTIGGTGLGAVNTILTFTSAGNGTEESGLVSWNGSADTTIADPTGTQIAGAMSAVAFAAITPGSQAQGAYTPNNATQMSNGQSQNKTITLGSTGWTKGDGLEIVFNPSEPQNTKQDPAINNITLNQLVMTVYSASGSVLFSAPWLQGPMTLVADDAGTGNSGFGFKLDATETAELNAVAGIGTDNHIGLFAYASDATGGHETFFGTVVACTGDNCNDPPIPEPMSFALLGVGLLGLGTVKFGSKLI